MTPLVSVIIPAYNAEAYIAEALASVSAQTLQTIEIIVVDDASTDSTAMLVRRAAGSDPRIRLVQMPANAGPSAARNRAIDAACGNWIALLDADDSYLPDRLERLVALAEREAATMCSDNLVLVPEATPGRSRPMIPAAVLSHDRPLALHEFIKRNVADKDHPDLNFGFLKPIIAREFIANHGIRYDEAVRFAEDFALYVDCLRAGAAWWLTPYAGYRYRVRQGSLTQVQTVADLAVLRSKQRELSEAAYDDPDLAALVARHAQAVDRNYYYRAFTDALKARQYAAAQHQLFASRRSGLLIMQEIMRQLPILTKKLLSGGYCKVSKG